MTKPKARCTAQAPLTATDLVTKYLTAKRIGIAPWAFDYPHTIFQQIGGQGLTNFVRFSCEGKGFSGKFGGDGQLFYTAFTAERNRHVAIPAGPARSGDDNG